MAISVGQSHIVAAKTGASITAPVLSNIPANTVIVVFVGSNGSQDSTPNSLTTSKGWSQILSNTIVSWSNTTSDAWITMKVGYCPEELTVADSLIFNGGASMERVISYATLVNGPINSGGYSVGTNGNQNQSSTGFAPSGDNFAIQAFAIEAAQTVMTTDSSARTKVAELGTTGGGATSNVSLTVFSSPEAVSRPLLPAVNWGTATDWASIWLTVKEIGPAPSQPSIFSLQPLTQSFSFNFAPSLASSEEPVYDVSVSLSQEGPYETVISNYVTKTPESNVTFKMIVPVPQPNTLYWVKLTAKNSFGSKDSAPVSSTSGQAFPPGWISNSYPVNAVELSGTVTNDWSYGKIPTDRWEYANVMSSSSSPSWYRWVPKASYNGSIVKIGCKSSGGSTDTWLSIYTGPSDKSTITTPSSGIGNLIKVTQNDNSSGSEIINGVSFSGGEGVASFTVDSSKVYYIAAGYWSDLTQQPFSMHYPEPEVSAAPPDPAPVGHGQLVGIPL